MVLTSPGLMLLWGLVLTALTLLPWGAGLVLIGPLLGHASWHAYRGAVGWQESAQGQDEPPASIS